jgi:predicted TIM-barrel fold metal-dependent hydrolase
MTTENHRIDVHYHIIPKPYVDALARRGITGAAWVNFPKWAPNMAIRQLDRMEIATAVTSLSTPGVWFGDAALARDLARLCNEFQARMMSDHPGRFGAFAFLPLPDVDGALAEMEHAMDHLGHDGVALLSDVDGRYLGDPIYEEFFAELDRRSAVVFIHPHTDPREEREYEFFCPLLEWPVHTSRAVLDLLYSGRLARYPNIRYILAHGGGTVPYLAHRIAAGPGSGGRTARGNGRAGGGVPSGADGGTHPEQEGEVRTRLRLLRGLYYDAASPGEGHFVALKKLAGVGHILFGTDGGWTPPVETSLKIKALLAYDGFTPSELAAIERKNAASLFPRFAPGDAETAGPVA